MAECSKRQKTAAGCSKRKKLAERKETTPVGSSIVSRLAERMDDISHGAKEVFLWQIVREANQDLYLMRHEAYFDTKKIVDPRGLFIEIFIDKINRTLSIVDNGIGWKEDYLRTLFLNLPDDSVENCEAIIDKLKLVNRKKNITVDEFYVRDWNAGLGFFAAYMVADKVQITTKHYGGDTHWTLISSPRDNLFSFESCTESSLQAGTKVTLHLNEDHFEYLDEHRLKVLIDKCSFDLCPYPISIRVLPCGDIIQRSADAVVVTEKDMKSMKRKFEGLRKLFQKVLDAWVEKVVVSDRIFDLPTNLSLDGKKLEINPRSRMMETLRQKALCDPKAKEVVDKIRAQFLGGVIHIQRYDIKHKTNFYRRAMNRRR